jgi:hypothetical protein
MVELARRQLEVRELFARHDARGDFRDRNADHLGDERHVREARGLTSST